MSTTGIPGFSRLKSPRPAESTGGRPVFTRVQILGMGILATMQVVVTVAAIAPAPAMAGEVLAFFLPVLAITLLALWLLRRFGAWARVLGIVVSLSAGGLMLPDALAGFSPASPANVILGIGVPLGCLLGVGGGIAATVAARRGRFEAAETSGERKIRIATLSTIGLAILVSIPLYLQGKSTVNPAAAQGAVPVDMSGFAFQPDEIRVSAGNPRLLIHNRDALMHDLAVPALDTLVRVAPGSSAIVEFSGAAPGTYLVFCTLHSDTTVVDPSETDMAGRLTIT